jgi:hypothetical protein
MNTISHSRRLRQKIELLLPQLDAISAELTSHPRFRELYPEVLIAMHQGMRASVPLLQTALRRCRELEHADPVAAALVPYFAQHVKEEDHDRWALEDLEVLGVPRAEVLRRIPSPTVAAMVGSQYYWVLHHHPVAMLGDMMAREGYPPSVAAVDRMIAQTGYPRTAFRTIERHCRLDVHHRDDLIEVLDGLPLREEHHTALGISALHTVHLMTQLFREVLERAPKAKVRAGA